MIGTIELMAFFFVGGLMFCTGVHFERWQVRQEQRREWNDR
jgi:hypothetical protein